MTKSLYIAATNQHVGKTTTTLGILAALAQRGLNVGYCKPVGQQHLVRNGGKIDKDCILFAETLGFEIEPDIHSPVIMDNGYTSKFIDNPEKDYLYNRINHAVDTLNERHDIVIHEGTGHPGVGSIVELSNADVAKNLNTGVIIVVKGGIGNTYDRLTLCKSVFQQRGVPILGVIVNKIYPEKIDKIKHYLGKRLESAGIEVFGYIPYNKELAHPLISTVNKAVKGEIKYYSEFKNNLAQGVIAGSLIDLEDLDTSKKYLLVVSARRLLESLEKLNHIFWDVHQIKPNLAGLVLTGISDIPERALKFIHKHKIPTIHTKYDTYETIIRISRIEVKLNMQAPNKIAEARKMVEQYVDIDRICEVIGLETV